MILSVFCHLQCTGFSAESFGVVAEIYLRLDALAYTHACLWFFFSILVSTYSLIEKLQSVIYHYMDWHHLLSEIPAQMKMEVGSSIHLKCPY